MVLFRKNGIIFNIIMISGRIRENMDYITVAEASGRWNISDRRIRLLCSQGRIEGVVKAGRSYRIPAETVKPVDGRTLKGKDILAKHQALFARIDAKKVELGKRRLSGEAQWRRRQQDFLVDFIYHSNAIEGNSLTWYETELILQGITIAHKPLNEHLKVMGQKDAFDYLSEMVLDKAKLSEALIKEINVMLLMDKRDLRGVYRRVPAQVDGAENPLPEPYLIPMLMEWLVKGHLGESGKLHVIEVVTRFHMDFEGIHPFVEGNGRTGRLLLNFGLMQAGYLPIRVRLEDKERYYQAFRDYHLKKEADGMIFLIARYMETEMDKYLQLSKRRC